MAKKRWKSKEHKRRWMASPKGQAWLEKKMAEAHARRPDPGPAPERLTRTKFPFTAIVNSRPIEITGRKEK